MGQDVLKIKTDVVRVNLQQQPPVVVTPRPTPQSPYFYNLNSGDYIETSAAGSADVTSNGTTVAKIAGQNPTQLTVYPPGSTTTIYYNNSYRYKLNTPNGYIGIRA